MPRKWFIYTVTHPEAVVHSTINQRVQIVGELPAENTPTFEQLPILRFYLDMLKRWAKEAQPGDFCHYQGQNWTVFCVNLIQATQKKDRAASNAIYYRADEITKALPEGHGTLPSTIVTNAALELAAEGVVQPGYNPQTDSFDVF